jgi:FAD/FMN-containing dehydrogenase
MRIGGGYQWSDVYAVARANNVIVVGGGAPSIGAIGGWLQGRGYGPAAQQHGIGADQVLEAEVALANGSVITANACQNIDIYTAIRGGGPSEYGVVLSATFKTYAMATAAHQRLSFAYSPSTRSKFLDAIAVLYSSAPDLLDAGFTMSGFWSLANSSLVGSAPSGYFHNAYAMNKTVAEGQAKFAPLLERLTNLGINVTQSWTSYDNFWKLFNNVSGGDDPGFPVGAIASRFFDRKALQNNTSLREMLDVLAGPPDDITLHGSMCMSGGQIWKNADDPYTAVHPAWRTSYCLQLSQRSWPSDADESLISAIKHEVSTVKAAAMKAFAPDTGTYMNEADRNDPDYKANFYGSNYDRLLEIKRERDPKSVFYCPTCVGSDQWAEDKTGRLCRA